MVIHFALFLMSDALGTSSAEAMVELQGDGRVKIVVEVTIRMVGPVIPMSFLVWGMDVPGQMKFEHFMPVHPDVFVSLFEPSRNDQKKVEISSGLGRAR